jgi:hypothetical protein
MNEQKKSGLRAAFLILEFLSQSLEASAAAGFSSTGQSRI